MRSRHDKRRRSRISPIDRLIQTQAGSAIVAVVRSTGTKPEEVLSSDLASDLASDRSPAEPESPPLPKRKNMVKRIIHRLQYPVGWRPVIILILTWVLMMGIIWGAFKEIMSLGASPTKQTIAQIERKTLLEFLGALCLGGIGLSLALTPALKRPPRSRPEPLQAQLDSDE